MRDPAGPAAGRARRSPGGSGCARSACSARFRRVAAVAVGQRLPVQGGVSRYRGSPACPDEWAARSGPAPSVPGRSSGRRRERLLPRQRASPSGAGRGASSGRPGRERRDERRAGPRVRGPLPQDVHPAPAKKTRVSETKRIEARGDAHAAHSGDDPHQGRVDPGKGEEEAEEAGEEPAPLPEVRRSLPAARASRRRPRRRGRGQETGEQLPLGPGETRRGHRAPRAGRRPLPTRNRGLFRQGSDKLAGVAPNLRISSSVADQSQRLRDPQRRRKSARMAARRSGPHGDRPERARRRGAPGLRPRRGWRTAPAEGSGSCRRDSSRRSDCQA